MNTEEETLGKLRNERRKVFWRLYSLPWLICTIFLLGTIGLLLYSYRSFSAQNTRMMLGVKDGIEVEVGDRVLGEMRTETVRRGFGYWEVGVDGKTIFQWKGSNLVYVVSNMENRVQIIYRTNDVFRVRDLVRTNDIMREVVREVVKTTDVVRVTVVTEGNGEVETKSKGINRGENVTGVITRETLDGVGAVNYDIEGLMGKDVTEMVDLVGDKYGIVDKEFRKEVKDRLLVVLKLRFDGLRTYQRVTE